MWLGHGLIEFLDVASLVLVAKETGGKRVSCQLMDVIGIQIQRLLYAQKIFAYVAAEIGGIVGIDGCANSGIYQSLEIVVFQGIEDAEFEIG